MKIAVLTMTFNNNYGGMLQAYSLIEILKRLGHEPELIFVQFENREIKNYYKVIIKKYILSYILSKWKDLRYSEVIEKNISHFINQYINPKTDPIFCEKDFKKIVADKYDAYIIGSDQVWRPKMYRFINHAFFDFVKNPRAILLSYAASFGVDTWEYNEIETKIYKENIKRFKAVSVREDSGVDLCSKYFDINAVQLIDPTLLLTVDDYRNISCNETPTKGELLTYILDETNEKFDIADFISKHFGYSIFSNNVKSKTTDVPIDEKIYPSVTSWIKSFDNAKFVLTDSYHGCIFSILFNKPFLVYGNKNRGMARFQSLLRIFGLENRLIHSIYDINTKILQDEINWQSINIAINEQRIKSFEFLTSNLQS